MNNTMNAMNMKLLSKNPKMKFDNGLMVLEAKEFTGKAPINVLLINPTIKNIKNINQRIRKMPIT